MRTLVKTTPFDPPNPVIAIAASSFVACRGLQHRRVLRPHARRPHVFRGEARAFLWLLDRRPVAALRQRLDLSALDPLRKPLRRCRRGDGSSSPVTRSVGQRRSREGRRPSRRQRLAGLREALRILAQVAFANERYDDRIVALVVVERPAAATASAMAIMPLRRASARPIPQALARGVAGSPIGPNSVRLVTHSDAATATC